MIHNILGDFLNKEIRRVYGLYENISRAQHERALEQWVNAAIFLAPDYCLIPIGFVAESGLLRRVIERKEALLFGRALRLAIRDAEIDTFIQRRRLDYKPFADDYKPLFDDDTIVFLQRYAVALQGRHGRSASALTLRWPSAIETSAVLDTLRSEVEGETLRTISEIPSRIADDGLGLTWNAIREILPPIATHNSQAVRSFLHAEFIRGYLTEYDLRLLTGLPYGWRDLGVQARGGYYDYEWLAAALEPLGILKLLLDLDAPSLLRLKREAGCSEFQLAFHRICGAVESLSALRLAFGRAAAALARSVDELRAGVGLASGGDSVALDENMTALLGHLLSEAAHNVLTQLDLPHDLVSQQSGGERIYVDEIDSFAAVSFLPPDRVSKYLEKGRIDLSEDVVQQALEQILTVPVHKVDWGGETNDLYTANVMIKGRRVATAFMLKGNGLKAAQMEIKHCGKNGDQLMRLIASPAELFVVQYVGPISEAVIGDMDGKIRGMRAAGRAASYCIIDGQDTARLLHAFGSLPA